MAKAMLFLTDGFEEIEALTVLDVLRRGAVEIDAVSLTGRLEVTGAHDITVQADMTYHEMAQNPPSAKDLLILPGGPGTANYQQHQPLLDLLVEHHHASGRIAAICAAPSVLGMLGLLEGKKAVCYPSFEETLTGAKIGRKAVVKDGGIITSQGPATALLFSLAILREMQGKKAAKAVRKQMLEPVLRHTYA